VGVVEHGASGGAQTTEALREEAGEALGGALPALERLEALADIRGCALDVGALHELARLEGECLLEATEDVLARRPFATTVLDLRDVARGAADALGERLEGEAQRAPAGVDEVAQCGTLGSAGGLIARGVRRGF
jgi:hypothetical protein